MTDNTLEDLAFSESSNRFLALNLEEETGGDYIPPKKKQNTKQKKPQKNLMAYIDAFGSWKVSHRIIVCIDFEATCSGTVQFDRDDHEIIEFPAIAIDTKTNTKIGEFHSYVRPTRNPTLTPFCTNLTGITQDVIDSSPDFNTAMKNFLAWLGDLHSQITDNPREESPKVHFATHGQADLYNFLKNTLKANRMSIPEVFRGPFIDIMETAYKIASKNRESFMHKNLQNRSGHKISKFRNLSLVNLCKAFDLPFIGRNHSGKDDANMIATLLQTWANAGHLVTPNSPFYK